MRMNDARLALVGLLIVLVGGCAQESSMSLVEEAEVVQELEVVDEVEIVDESEVVEGQEVVEEPDAAQEQDETQEVVEEPEDIKEPDVVAPVDAGDSDDGEADVETVEPPPPPSTPPFWGAVYVTPDAITPASPTDLVSVRFKVVDTRWTFDRRVDGWVDTVAWVYEASYRCGRPLVDVVVNQEFSREQADIEAQRFAYILGQLPAGVRTNVDELWIHAGHEPAGGGNRSILVHTEYVDEEGDFVEEIFLHEAAHTSLDPDWQGVVDAALWNEARADDSTFVSRYAETHPEREDVAESYGAYFVWALNRQSGSFPGEAGLIGAAIPGRLAYFDSLGPEYRPSRAGQCD